MNCRERVHRHLLDLPKIKNTDSEIAFGNPNETSPGRFSLLCFTSGAQKSIIKIVCTVSEPDTMRVEFFPLHRVNETGGYVPVPTNVKDIYTQYFQPLQVQSSYQNDRLMVG